MAATAPPAPPTASTSTLPKPTTPAAPSPTASPSAPEPDSDDDPLEIFSSGLFTTFAHVVPWHGNPNAPYTYTPPPNALPPPGASSATPLTIRVPPQAITSLHADAVWDASLLLANFISTGALDVRGKRVVELGAGAGLPSLMSARYGAGEVVLTDYDDPELVKNLEGNRMALGEEERGRLKVQGFCWGTPPAGPHLALNAYDLILLADTLWMTDTHSLLISSLVALLAHSPDARVHLVAGFHTGRSCVRAFERRAAAVGLVPRGKAWEEVSWEGDRREWGWDLNSELAGEEAIEERNKWVVQGELGWSGERLEEFGLGQGA